MRDIAVWVGQWPLGEGVGRKTLVHQAQCGNAARVLQVFEIGAHLVSQQQAFVNHRANGHAGNVVFLAVLKVQVLDGRAGGFADDIELALQRVLHDHIIAASDKHLPNNWFFFPHRGGHGHVCIERHIAPA